MKILVISAFLPMADKLGGDHRFFRFLEGLVGEHEVRYLAYAVHDQALRYGEEDIARYRRELEQAGIPLLPPGVRNALQGDVYDAVIFQNFFHMPPWIAEVRTFQPQARVIVDNGDVAFRRFFSKADLTGLAEDRAAAEKIKREELWAYARADIAITVSREDTEVVKAELPDLRTWIIPNIHPIPPASSLPKEPDSLIFVGSFLHPPNVDGMLYFVRDILPLIVAERPAVKLRIVGYKPPPEVEALASEHVEVVGFVPETAPWLDRSAISVAPLRYGAGVKGKIGEAMAHRLPVVTTTVGIDGFGLSVGENVLVGDSPAEFAHHVLDLLGDEALYARLAEAGSRFIREHFSEAAVREQIRALMRELPALPVQRLPAWRSLPIRLDALLERHLYWRLRRAG